MTLSYKKVRFAEPMQEALSGGIFYSSLTKGAPNFAFAPLPPIRKKLGNWNRNIKTEIEI
jgi:hypothetical protein